MHIQVEDTEIYGTRSTVIGAAVYSVTVENDFSADIGGTDGLTITNAELIRLELDGLHLNRDAVEKIAGKSVLEAFEEDICEEYSANDLLYAVAAE